MIPLLNSIKLEASIKDVVETQGDLWVVDGNFFLTGLDVGTFSIFKQRALVQGVAGMHPFAKKVVLNHTKKALLALYNGKAMLADFESEESRWIEGWHTKELEVVVFNDDTSLFALGGSDGRTTIYDGEEGNFIKLLPPRPDYTSTLRFSKDSRKLFSSSYDHSSVVFDLLRLKIIHRFKTDDVVEDAKFFHNDTMLYLVLRNGVSLIYDLIAKKMVSKQSLFNEWPTKIEIVEEDTFAIVGSRNNMLYIVDLKNNRLFTELKLDHRGVSLLKLRNQSLYIGFIDGMLVQVEYYRGIEELRIALKTNQFGQITQSVQGNIFLQLNIFYRQKLDEAWKSVYIEIVKLVSMGKIEEATLIAEPFFNDENREKEYSQLIDNNELIAEFKERIIKKEYKRALKLIVERPWLEKLPYFTLIEKEWGEVYKSAKRLLIEDAKRYRLEVAERLKPFSIYSKYQKQIEVLLKSPELFAQANTLVKERQFKQYFELLKRNTFLKQSPTYERVMQLADILFQKAIALEERQHYDEAKEAFAMLQPFTPYQDQVKAHLETIKLKHAFVTIVESKAFMQAYKMLESYPGLVMVKSAFDALNNEFNQILKVAHQHSFRGKVQETLSILEPFMASPLWREASANIMKVAYLNEIKIAYLENMQPIDWSATAHLYFSMFGKDNELLQLFSHLQVDEKILEALQSEEVAEPETLVYVESIVLYQH